MAIGKKKTVIGVNASASTVVEGGQGDTPNSVDFIVQLNQIPRRDITVDYNIHAQGSSPAQYLYDYTLTPTRPSGTLTFEAGTRMLRQRITLESVPDNLYEGNESVQMDLSPPTGDARLGGKSRAVVTIQDDDSLTATIHNAQAAEGNPLDFLVTLDQKVPALQQVVVYYDIQDITARANLDYHPPSGNLLFYGGQDTAHLLINTIIDDIIEKEESFRVTLTSGLGVGLGSLYEAMGVIVDANAPPIAMSDVIYLPYNSQNTYLLPLRDLLANDSDINGDDIFIQSVTHHGVPLEIDHQQQEVVLVAKPDALGDSTQVLTYTLSDGELSVIGSAILLIDTVPQVSVSDASVVEGDTGDTHQMFFTVTLDKISDTPVTIHYHTSDDTAYAGSDYTPQEGNLTFPTSSDNLSQTIAVTVFGNQTSKTDRSFYLNLTDATGAQIADSQAKGTIHDDDAQLSLVSIRSDGKMANGDSMDPHISYDGRYVVFDSSASNLATPDTNNQWDVLLKDMQTGSLLKVSSSEFGSEANSMSAYPFISGDGQYVIFSSGASNLVPGDTAGTADVFVKNIQSGQVIWLTHGSDSTAGNSLAGSALSLDGHYAAFFSSYNNIVIGDNNNGADVFWGDVSSDTLLRVNTDSQNHETTPVQSARLSITGDGRYVVFDSSADSLVSHDTNYQEDVFLKDRQTGEIYLISRGDSEANGGSYNPFIAANGRYIVFHSYATNLTPNDRNQHADVFLKDMETGLITRLSTSLTGTEGNDNSYQPSLSAEGRYAVFVSDASNLVSGDNNHVSDVFVKDTQTGAIAALSVSAQGVFGNGASDWVSISGDGRYCVFQSTASNLTGQENYSGYDVFITPNPLFSLSDQVIVTTSWDLTLKEGSADDSLETLAVVTLSLNQPSAQDITISYHTQRAEVSGDHDATENQDYMATQGSILFKAGEISHKITVPIIPDYSPEADEVFQLVIETPDRDKAILSGEGLVDITIEDDDAMPQSITKVSVAQNGESGDGDSGMPLNAISLFYPAATLSEDGHLVAFASTSSNLVKNQSSPQGVSEIFVKNLLTGEVILASSSEDGVAAKGGSEAPVLSGDGTMVVFDSLGNNLIANDNNPNVDIFIKYLDTGKVDRISVNPAVGESNGDSYMPALSSDGSRVVFKSISSTLLDNHSARDSSALFLYDTASLKSITINADGVPANDHEGIGYGEIPGSGSDHTAISSDGEWAAFVSWSDNLVSEDTNNTSDVFITHLDRGEIMRVSVSGQGEESHGDNSWGVPSLSADGEWITFTSFADNLVDNDRNQAADIFVKNRITGEIVRASTDANGKEGAFLRSSIASDISDDGRYVVFQTTATLVSGDKGSKNDIYIKDMETGGIACVSRASDGAFGNNHSSNPSISADGHYVTFASQSTNLVINDDIDDIMDIFTAPNPLWVGIADTATGLA